MLVHRDGVIEDLRTFANLYGRGDSALMAVGEKVVMNAKHQGL